MQLRSLRHHAMTRPVDGYFVRAVLPLDESDDQLVQSILAPLHRRLGRSGLGRIAKVDLVSADDGERLWIDLSLVSEAPSALRRLAGILEDLGALPGSTVGLAECLDMIPFGRARSSRCGTANPQPTTRTDATLPAWLRGREPLLEEAIHRVILAEASCRSAREGRRH